MVKKDNRNAGQQLFENFVHDSVFERDNNKCLLCPNAFNLTIHHIKSQKRHPELAYDFTNMVTLCDDCHKHLENLNKANKEQLNKKLRDLIHNDY